MEQRHQHFIIARINGRYRSLATIHQQRMRGLHLVKRCRDTLRILRAGNNRVPIQEEVKAAERYEEGFWTQGPFEEGDHSNTAAEVPFPFLMTCLMLGTTYYMIGGCILNGTIGHRQMKYNEGGKNDSITIYDITDHSRIRYCFVVLTDPRFPLMVPLSARTYLDTYYHARELEENSWKEIVLVLRQIEGFSLVPTAVPEGIWPDGDWKEPHDSQKNNQPPDSECDGMATVERHEPTSLRDYALEKLVQTLVEDPESARQVAPAAEVLADFWPRLKGKIYEHAKILRPSLALLDLLCASLKEEMYVDLSPFHTLTCADLSLLVSRLQSHGQMRRLNLSNMPNLTSEGLASVLGPEPKQRLLGLYLMENPQIPVELLGTLNCACDIYHSELLRRSIIHKPVRPNSLGERDSARPALPHLDFFTGDNAVTQIVLIGLTEDQTLSQRDRKPDGSMFWETLSATTEPPTPTSLHGADRLQYDAIPLVGVPLAPLGS